MFTNDISLEDYQLNPEKLQACGFEKTAVGYHYSRMLKLPSFQLLIEIAADNRMKTRIIDLDVNEVYMLHLNQATQGEFVGKVREEYHQIITDILTTCFSKRVFTAAQSLRVIQHIKQHYDTELEFLWAKFPRNAIARRQDNHKWFAALLTVERSKLGLTGEGIIEVLDLKMRPEQKQSLLDNIHYLPGYHMNKNHWFTICLDERVTDDEIFGHLEQSYRLA